MLLHIKEYRMIVLWFGCFGISIYGPDAARIMCFRNIHMVRLLQIKLTSFTLIQIVKVVKCIKYMYMYIFLKDQENENMWFCVFLWQLLFGYFTLKLIRICNSWLSSKLLGQGNVMERLKSSLRKFYGRYGDLIKHNEVSLSQMLHDILGHDHVQWHPQLIRHYTNLRTYYRTGLYYRFWTYYQILEVSIEHCNGCG